jgi:Transposase domain (DUF772)
LIRILVAGVYEVVLKTQFDKYSGPFSPKRFTQAQLLTLLILKRGKQMSYRRLTEEFDKSSELRRAMGLKRVPHYSTLAHAEPRLLALLGLSDSIKVG